MERSRHRATVIAGIVCMLSLSGCKSEGLSVKNYTPEYRASYLFHEKKIKTKQSLPKLEEVSSKTEGVNTYREAIRDIYVETMKKGACYCETSNFPGAWFYLEKCYDRVVGTVRRHLLPFKEQVKSLLCDYREFTNTLYNSHGNLRELSQYYRNKLTRICNLIQLEYSKYYSRGTDGEGK
ncbi:hypothetical protein [Desulfurobacterium sp.]|uniref:hypothetical protein n=1 Tax=Desulfurobacterium sp. TaxID=2004706 RepID=UPI002604A04A|nr:hypothetical protein [Desulfurobacterium sp.]